jgi:predicted house-cleaning noncanonical NTP pyrophosphatase (MazG superfamily)
VKYNKLVRDKIPDIIMRRGDKPVTQILDAGAYRRELRRKLQEEVAEFGESGEVEELADVLEVVYALAKSCMPWLRPKESANSNLRRNESENGGKEADSSRGFSS